ncbi:sulfite exporter TauE/SafE family protein [Cryomorphaceae bacterium]|nr:sulfite exporter TauE/SafE family protein [Cryomorphaceae bacterium]
MNELVYTGFALGIMGSVHCLGMCGPIALSLPVDRSRPLYAVLSNLFYQLGRVTTYAALGLLFGWLGRGLQLAGIQQYLSIGVGIAMIVLVVFPRASSFFSRPLTGRWLTWTTPLKSALARTMRADQPQNRYLFGLLNGLLPCGLVYIALVGSVGVGSALGGATYMALFGLGTIPMMFLAMFAGNVLHVSLRQRLQKMIPVVVVIIGALFILRGMGLGIPYVSPPDTALELRTEQGLVGSDEGCH